jgi:hypothetical protein
MTKGLQRSINRGPETLQDVINMQVAFSQDITITGVDSAVDAGTAVIGGLPVGNLLLLGAVAYVSVDAGEDANVIDNWDGDYAIGTAPNDNDVDVGDAGEANIIPSTAISAGDSDKLAPRTRTTTTGTEQGVILDNTDGSLELNFNLLIDDNVITDTEDGVFTVAGNLYIAFVVLGDD